jgi:hypothetical protein
MFQARRGFGRSSSNEEIFGRNWSPKDLAVGSIREPLSVDR